MKLSLDKVIFLNLCFRLYVLVRLLKNDGPDVPEDWKSSQQWLQPLSKRIFLISINGLWDGFLKENSTPFLQEVVDKRGTFGIARASYMGTNHNGLVTMLTGRETPSSQLFLDSRSCIESLLDSIKCKCGTGDLPRNLPLQCSVTSKILSGNFFLPKNTKQKLSCLYVMSFGIDPVLRTSYRARLGKIDEKLRTFWKALEDTWDDNGTTVIVTSARASPVGDRWSAEVPVVAWGAGIAHSPETVTMKQKDLGAVLTTLLGLHLPKNFFGVLPPNLMNLTEVHQQKITLFTIQHLETAHRITKVRDSLDPLKMDQEQLSSRLDKSLARVKKENTLRWILIFALVILLLLLWAVAFILHSVIGSVVAFSSRRASVLFLFIVALTVANNLPLSDLIFAVELLSFVIWENFKEFRTEVYQSAKPCLSAVGVTLAAAFVVGVLGNTLAVPVVFFPVVFWPLFNGSFRKINTFVLVTRFVTGLVLVLLHFSRKVGELPNVVLATFVVLLFLFDFYAMFAIFKRKFDFHIKVTYVTIALTIVHLNLLYRFFNPWAPAFSWVYVASFLFLVHFTRGTLLERLFKIFLSLLIPVLMMSVTYESVFFVSMVFHVFTWAFIEYHGTHPNELQFNPSIFSVEPKQSSQSSKLTFNNVRQVIFFLVYCYVAYFAMGHHPALHPYDLYAVPRFIYKFPALLSYCLAAFKFFLPFFIVTATFMTLITLQEKSFKLLIPMCIWLSDVCGCWLILSNRTFDDFQYFSENIRCFFVQQLATVCIIASYFLSNHLLFASDKPFWKWLQLESVFSRCESY